MIILIIGGSGCGKSAFAESRIMDLAEPGHETIYYLATMQVFGEEARKKVERHIELRRGKGMRTIEQTKDIDQAVAKMEEGLVAVLLEDLGNLVANEMFDVSSRDGKECPEKIARKICDQLYHLAEKTRHLVIVTKQVFEDGIAYEEGTMDYIRTLGYINRMIAKAADEIVEVIAGIPVMRKRPV